MKRQLASGVLSSSWSKLSSLNAFLFPFLEKIFHSFSKCRNINYVLAFRKRLLIFDNQERLKGEDSTLASKSSLEKTKHFITVSSHFNFNSLS